MKKLQLVTKILVIVLITAIAFAGIYVQEQNRMENQVKDYSLGMGLEGGRVLTLTVSEETEEVYKDSEGNIIDESEQVEGEEYTTEEVAINSEEDLTVENFYKVKTILENRLKDLNVNEYNIKLDEETGKIVLEIPENDYTDFIVSNISVVGEFEIIDTETQEILMDNSYIDKASVLYNTTTTGTTVYLNIEFNKEGTEKLKEISQTYAAIEESTEDSSDETEDSTTTESAEESTSEDASTEESEETTAKEITMQLDGSELITTSFEEPIENGSIQLSVGSESADSSTINDSIDSASVMAIVLDTGNLPIEYEIYGNEYIATDITSNTILIVLISVGVILLIALLVLIIKYKKIGLLTSIAYIGFLSIFLLLIRYTNVTLTIEGAVAIALVAIANYIFVLKIINKIKEYGIDKINFAIKDFYKESAFKVIPACILIIVFCFISWIPISSFGMVMFWGLLLIYIYNFIVIKSLLKN